MKTKDDLTTEREARLIETHLELIFQRGGMAAVVAACRCAQARLAKRHPSEVFGQGWIV